MTDILHSNKNTIRRTAALLLAGVLSAGMLTGCSQVQDITSLLGLGSDSASTGETVPTLYEPIPEDYTVEAIAAREQAEREAAEEAARLAEEEANRAKMPEDCYQSELTGLPISNDLKDQRPVAIMVDNDERALPHYGLSGVDVMYEMMNSTENKRITRLMCLYKDWGSIDTVGSIRSVRPTNIMLAGEWNAVLAHDGGPYYIDEYFNKGYAPHFSGYFTRISNGKATEFTEYVVNGDLEKRFSSEGVSTTYTDYKGDHFQFAPYGQDELTLDGEDGAITANCVDIPFIHTDSELNYNASTGTYDYEEYGETSVDAGNNETVTFKNVIVISCSFYQYDANGYMVYNLVTDGTKGLSGYYATNGMAIPITWEKTSETGVTHYYKQDGTEITLNDGSTYIGIVPSDNWSLLAIN